MPEPERVYAPVQPVDGFRPEVEPFMLPGKGGRCKILVNVD
jgi:hypothetical protein